MIDVCRDFKGKIPAGSPRKLREAYLLLPFASVGLVEALSSTTDESARPLFEFQYFVQGRSDACGKVRRRLTGALALCQDLTIFWRVTMFQHESERN